MENICFGEKLPSCASHDTFIPCTRHALDWLYLGDYATPAVVHLAQIMVFQHQSEPEIGLV